MTSTVDFEALLKETIGLDAATIGSATIERAVQERRSACRLVDTSTYLEHVRTSPAELYELVEAVVVPETWFFRDRQAFAELVRLTEREWLNGQPQRVLRVLSVPCSTGEEPYSAAMALLDAGIPADRVRIDAVDVSERALTRARHAVYGSNSFRGNDLAFRDRHFERTGERYRLDTAARAAVTLQRGNLLAGDFLPGSELYDAIFCRNLLIYFDAATQNRTVDVLQRLLRPDGVLFVGPAESGLLLRRDFILSKAPLTFAFHKQGTRTVEPLRLMRPSLHPPRPPAPAPARPRVVVAPAPPLATPAPAAPVSTIEDAARLADQGRWAEATRACDDHVRAHGPTARTFQLLGMIANASGDLVAAVASFRKALYLDANDAEALIHLAFLLEKQGDLAGSRMLRNRLRRLAVNDAK